MGVDMFKLNICQFPWNLFSVYCTALLGMIKKYLILRKC